MRAQVAERLANLKEKYPDMNFDAEFGRDPAAPKGGCGGGK